MQNAGYTNDEDMVSMLPGTRSNEEEHDGDEVTRHSRAEHVDCDSKDTGCNGCVMNFVCLRKPPRASSCNRRGHSLRTRC
jgi:hypothetical protein